MDDQDPEVSPPAGEVTRLLLAWNGGDASAIERLMPLVYAELRQIAQDALEDALLMGCSEDQVREALHLLVDELSNPYRPD